MQRSLAEYVARRALYCCEYCQIPRSRAPAAFQFDHIIAACHGGPATAPNLAFACFLDNSFKGPNLAGVDPETQEVTRLFHPRQHKWNDHFRWEGAVLLGRSSIGRATIEVLRINLPDRIRQRAVLIREGVFPLA